MISVAGEVPLSEQIKEKLIKEKLIKGIRVKEKLTWRKCTFKARNEYGFKYCKNHKQFFFIEESGIEGGRICEGHYQCDPKNPGVKAILSPDYPFKCCTICLARAADK